MSDSDGNPRFGHTGGNAGYSCWLFTWPTTGTSMAMVTNNEMADEVLWAVLAAADRHHGGARPAQRHTATELAGTYRVHDRYTVEITSDRDNYALHIPGHPPLPLHALPDGRFRVTPWTANSC